MFENKENSNYNNTLYSLTKNNSYKNEINKYINSSNNYNNNLKYYDNDNNIINKYKSSNYIKDKIKKILYDIKDNKQYTTQDEIISYNINKKKQKNIFLSKISLISQNQNYNSLSCKERLLNMKQDLKKNFSPSPNHRINSYKYKNNNIYNKKDEFFNDKNHKNKIKEKNFNYSNKKAKSNKNILNNFKDYNKLSNTNTSFYINMKIRGLLKNDNEEKLLSEKNKVKIKEKYNDNDNSLISLIKKEVKKRRNYIKNN